MVTKLPFFYSISENYSLFVLFEKLYFLKIGQVREKSYGHFNVR